MYIYMQNKKWYKLERHKKESREELWLQAAFSLSDQATQPIYAKLKMIQKNYTNKIHKKWK